MKLQGDTTALFDGSGEEEQVVAGMNFEGVF